VARGVFPDLVRHWVGPIAEPCCRFRERERERGARDAYSYAHLPMVIGIILFAFAMRATLAHPGMELKLIPALALLWLRALPARLRLAPLAPHEDARGRAADGGDRIRAAHSAATSMPALAAVGLVAAVWICLHAYELLWWREERAQRKAAGAGDAGLDV
jgi:low temperature requirement protein LtrA